MRCFSHITRCVSLLILSFVLLLAQAPLDRDLGDIYASSQLVRVLVLGDFGYAGPDSGQAAVAKALLDLHLKSEFHLGLTVGDNFYPSGVRNVQDSHWKSEWHDRYDKLGIKFYATLGNHDYKGKPQAQVDYTNEQGNTTWRMPFRYYTFAAGPVRFFALDTDEGTLGFFNKKAWSDQQRDWLAGALTKHASARWKVVYGHHPVFSDGHHGDERRLNEKLLPVLKAHKVDVYLAGHDHDMQHFEVDNIQFFVVGGGGKDTREVEKKRAVFAEQRHGFMQMEASESQLVMRLIGTDGKEMHSKTLTK